MTLRTSDTQHNYTLPYSEFCYAECGILFYFNLFYFMLSVILLNVVLLNVVMLSVVAPQVEPHNSAYVEKGRGLTKVIGNQGPI
jgi:hypothetical protein